MPRPSRWNDIVAAAAEEFRSSGFEGATIEAIADRVGILKGSLYNYIDSKEDLLFAVIEEPARRLLAHLEWLREQADRRASWRLWQVIDIQVTVFAETYPSAFVYLAQIGMPSHRAEFREMDDEYMMAIEQIIQDGIEQGEFSAAIDPAVAARGLVGMLDWMQHWYVPHGPDEDRRIARLLYSQAVGGLAAAGLVHSEAHATPERGGSVGRSSVARSTDVAGN